MGIYNVGSRIPSNPKLNFSGKAQQEEQPGFALKRDPQAQQIWRNLVETDTTPDKKCVKLTNEWVQAMEAAIAAGQPITKGMALDAYNKPDGKYFPNSVHPGRFIRILRVVSQVWEHGDKLAKLWPISS